MNVYCECGAELEIYASEYGKISVFPHVCRIDFKVPVSLIIKGVPMEVEEVENLSMSTQAYDQFRYKRDPEVQRIPLVLVMEKE